MKQTILVIKYKEGEPVLLQAIAETETELNQLNNIIFKEAEA